MFAVDDDLESSPKFEALDQLPPARRAMAFEAWLRLGAACRKRGNGGLLTSALVDKILHSWKPKDRAQAIVDLVEARGGRESGLLVRDGDAYRFHEWDVWQPTSEEASLQRKARSAGAERQRRYRMRRAAGDAAEASQHASRVTDEVTEDVTSLGDAKSDALNVSRARDPVPVPSHPVTSRDQGGADLTGESAAPAIDRGAPDPSMGSAESLSFDAAIIATAVGDAIKAAGRTRPPRCGNPADRVWVQLVGFVREEAARSGRTFIDAAKALGRGFATDERARSKGYPLPWLAETPGEYLGGHAAPSSFAHVTTSALDRIPEADR